MNIKTIRELAHAIERASVTFRECANVFFEHRAVRVHRGFAEDLQQYALLGYQVAHQQSDTAVFLRHERSGDRIELISPDALEHMAYALPDRRTAEHVVLRLGERMTHQTGFVKVEGSTHDDSDLLAAMFRHIETGEVIQIIWRRHQIYPEVFQAATV